MEETTAEKRESMIAKITALLNHAESKGCTPEESESFYSKAQDLMTKWAIDEELLKMSGKKVDIDDVIKTVRFPIPSTYFMQLITLWAAVAKANDCRVLYSKGYRTAAGEVIVTGYESDLGRVQLLVTSLQLFALREAQRESKAQGGDYYFRRSFIDAFAHRIGARLIEARATTVKTAESSAPGLGLALIDKGKQVDSFVNSTMRVGKARRGGGTRYDSGGASAGRKAADRADLGQRRAGGGNRGSLGS